MKSVVSAFVLIAAFVAPIRPAAAQAAPSGAYLVIELDRDTQGWIQAQALWNELSAALSRQHVPIELTPQSGVFDGHVFIQLAHPEQRDRALGLIARALQSSSQSDGWISVRSDRHADLISIRPRLAAARAREGRLIDQLVESARAQLTSADFGAVSVLRRADDSVAIAATGISDPMLIRRVFQRDVVTLNAVDDDVSREDVAALRLPETDMLVHPIQGITDSRAPPLAVQREPVLSGEHFVSFRPTIDEVTLESAILFRFDREGTRLFCDYTRAHVGKRLAVLISGELATAPRINEPICGGIAQIAGSFTAAEVVAFTSRLASGSLPAPIVVSGQGQGLSPAFDNFSARQISAMEKLVGEWRFVGANPEDSPLAQPFRGDGRTLGGRPMLTIRFSQNAEAPGAGLEWRLSFGDDPHSQLVTSVDLDAREVRTEGRATILQWEHGRLTMHVGSEELHFERRPL